MALKRVGPLSFQGDYVGMQYQNGAKHFVYHFAQKKLYAYNPLAKGLTLIERGIASADAMAYMGKAG